MSQEVQLAKKVYGRGLYPQIIDINFNQLIPPTGSAAPNVLTIPEFFEAYDNLFYEIPVEGDINSHLELIRRSTEYVGVNQNAGEIDALLDEINQLRLENLSLQQTISDLTASK